jgi:hypothetical protein
MIIKIVLISLVLLSAGWFLVNRSKAHARAGIRIIVIIFAMLAITTIVLPGTANDVANILGVGRGADLILYLLTTLFLFFILTYYVRIHEDQKKLVILARKIAIIEANNEYKKKKFK